MPSAHNFNEESVILRHDFYFSMDVVTKAPDFYFDYYEVASLDHDLPQNL